MSDSGVTKKAQQGLRSSTEDNLRSAVWGGFSEVTQLGADGRSAFASDSTTHSSADGVCTAARSEAAMRAKTGSLLSSAGNSAQLSMLTGGTSARGVALAVPGAFRLTRVSHAGSSGDSSAPGARPLLFRRPRGAARRADSATTVGYPTTMPTATTTTTALSPGAGGSSQSFGAILLDAATAPVPVPNGTSTSNSREGVLTGAGMPSSAEQRALADGVPVAPIHLDGSLRANSFMSLSSAVSGRSGSFQALLGMAGDGTSPIACATAASAGVALPRRTLPAPVMGERGPCVSPSPTSSDAPVRTGRRTTLPLVEPANTMAPTPSSNTATPCMDTESVSGSSSPHTHPQDDPSRPPTVMGFHEGDTLRPRRPNTAAAAEPAATMADAPATGVATTTAAACKEEGHTDAILQLAEFAARDAAAVSEEAARERVRQREVSLYLWRCRRGRAAEVAAAAARLPLITMASLEREERALAQREMSVREAHLARQHEVAMADIARAVPPRQPTVASRLSSENTATFMAATAAQPSDAVIDAEVARRVAIRHFATAHSPASGSVFFPDSIL